MQFIGIQPNKTEMPHLKMLGTLISGQAPSPQQLTEQTIKTTLCNLHNETHSPSPYSQKPTSAVYKFSQSNAAGIFQLVQLVWLNDQRTESSEISLCFIASKLALESNSLLYNGHQVGLSLGQARSGRGMKLTAHTFPADVKNEWIYTHSLHTHTPGVFTRTETNLPLQVHSQNRGKATISLLFRPTNA